MNCPKEYMRVEFRCSFDSGRKDAGTVLTVRAKSGCEQSQ